VLSPGQKVAIYQSKEAAAAAANAGVNAGVNSGANASAQPVAAVAADRKEIAVGAAK
jgi:multidrug efflux system membrane fusion protein